MGSTRGNHDSVDAVDHVGDSYNWAVAQLAAIDRSQSRIEFNRDGVIIDVNDNYLRTLGYHRDELLGRHHRQFVPLGERNSTEYGEFWQSLRAGTSRRGEFVRLAKDGSHKWIQASYIPVHTRSNQVDKIVEYAIDITAQKLAEQTADRAARLYNAQLAAIDRSQGRIEFNPDGVIIDINSNYQDMVGYSRREVLGRHHSMFISDEEQADKEYRDFWQRLREGVFHSGEFRRFAKDGSERWIQATYNPVTSPTGEVEKVVKYAVDISAKKQLEQQAAHRSRLEAIGAVAAGAAHEINSPLQCICSTLDFLLGQFEQERELRELLAKELDEQATSPSRLGEQLVRLNQKFDFADAASARRESLGEALEQAKIIADIVAAMNIASAPASAEGETFLLTKAVAQAIRQTELSWSPHATVDIDIQPHDVCLQGVRTDIQRALTHALTNAAHAIAHAKARYERKGHIQISGQRRANGDYELSVSDSGIGMPEEVRERAFDAFFTTRDVGVGRGQGLAVIYDIVVNAHEGYVDLDSVEDAGTKLTLVFPSHRVEGRRDPPSSPIPSYSEEALVLDS